MLTKWFRKRRVVIEVKEEIYAWCPSKDWTVLRSYTTSYFGHNVTAQQGVFSISGDERPVSGGFLGLLGI